MSAFFDTNILIYAFTNDPKRDRAREVLADGGVISAQVLNEFTSVSRRKHARSWAEIEMMIGDLRSQFDAIAPLTAATHAAALALARDHNFNFYDALILASAIEAKCDVLYSEDMQNGRKIAGVTIVDPFG